MIRANDAIGKTPVTPGQLPTDSPAAATLQPGQIVAGTFHIERLIGRGGMAAVWEATNRRTGKRVALKVIAGDSGADPVAVAMLRREAAAASRVNHPNVVNIYDVVEDAETACVVMEILEGEPLNAYLTRKGYLGFDEAAALLLPAMRGVAAANAMGVIHRDLKPKNIFICSGPDGRLLTTKVLDFGIAVIRDLASPGPLPADVVPTHGTPAYMSPEHIQGLADIDARADVYGFGVLFFEALTGQLPFLGEPGTDLLMRIVHDPAPKVSVFRHDLDDAVVAMVARATAKDPAERYPDLESFIAEVEGLMATASSLPRALTPIAGVPILTVSEPRASGPTAAGAVPREVTDRPSDVTDTRRLYALGRPGGADTAVPAAEPERPASAAVPAPAEASPWRRRTSNAVLFLGALAAVAWLALTPRVRTVDRSGSARVASDAGEVEPALSPGSPDGGR
jgi:serine/threonine-protein kinase